LIQFGKAPGLKIEYTWIVILICLKKRTNNMKNVGMIALSVLTVMTSAQIAFGNPRSGSAAAGSATAGAAASAARTAQQAAGIRSALEANLGAAIYSQLPQDYRSASETALARMLSDAPIKASVLEAASKVEMDSVNSLPENAQKAVTRLLTMAVAQIDTLSAGQQQKLAKILNELAAQNDSMNLVGVQGVLAANGVNLQDAAACTL
jgi:hypothetical protein